MPDNREELKAYRLEMARERLCSSKFFWRLEVGVIAYFQKEYVKTGKFEKKYSKYISQAFQIRNNTDYMDFFIVSLQDAKEQYERAEEFVQVIEEFLSISNIDNIDNINK